MTRRILIVDDDGLILKGMSRALAREGWEVTTRRRASDGLAVLRSMRIDAVIVDYDLGDHTGLEVLEWMQEHLHSTVRILMTGHDDLPAIVDAVNRGGAFKVLRKPFQHKALLGALDGALEKVTRFVEAGSDGVQERSLAEQNAIEQLLVDRAIDLAVQPIVRGPTGEHFAYEALMRPRSTRYPTPLALLVAVEEHGRVHDLGGLVLDRAAERIADLPVGAMLFVNLHPSQLGNPQRLSAAVEPLRPFATRVVFEITERSRLQDIEHWEESIAVLTGSGFSIAVDDLGAGYSALSMLADLQPDYIKLDMSLIEGIAASPRKQRLVQVLSTFASATGAQVIAEGVEQAEQAQCLMDCGIDLLQGYLYGRPSTKQP